ncbi:Peptidyl-prolyl cis-trans isomerase D [Rhynchospora pubera]|uniref:Peptidyl-prolyl cis-trans isomerase D n=1 Tax=Rhynchospora pubera TaxID=906938 RepID=A0AAV8BNK1_9POAL|nr:Peptidyl-prolyl cis-trans isomerase D [Rhynchospora pubera]KAJ4745751.1 Peptidyl-prolyl cis-trans isomerase D [Rhynchospora pubera]
MFNGMMDPELFKLAQEQMSRIPPEEFARMQQQMMANPDLVKMATESMKNMRTEDFKRAAEQIRQTRPEDMAEITDRMAKAKPEEIAAMKARADAQINYEISAAQLLKQEGNELHSRGHYSEAVNKYKRAKDNVKNVPSASAQTLQLQCSLNLMSCYLKSGQFNECIAEGTEVLSYESKNIKALYRRGQAYRELGNFEAALVDLKKATKISPDDETIANVYRDVKDRCASQKRTVSKGVIIEEIDDEETEEEDEKAEPTATNQQRSVVENTSSPPAETTVGSSSSSSINSEQLRSLGEDPATIRLFQNYVSNSDPEVLSRLSAQQGMSPDMIKTATEMIKTMKPDELQKMFQVASSLNQTGPSNQAPNLRPNMPEMSPEMVKMASETISKMPPEEVQRMMNTASSSLGPGWGGRSSSPEASEGGSKPSVLSDGLTRRQGAKERGESSVANAEVSSADLQEAARSTMNDPAMRQMMANMMKNMDPEMMVTMGQQFGMKISKEDAAKAQQQLGSLSPEDLDRMMRWAEKAQKGIETAKRTKNWLLGRPGMILAIIMLILAFILHQLGFIGG